MTTTKWLKSLVAAVMLVFLPQAHAGLIEVNDDLYYDDVANVTWMKNAFYIVDIGADDNGKLNWADATDWAAQLTAFNTSDWKLPTLEEALSLQLYREQLPAFFGEDALGKKFWTSEPSSSGNNGERTKWFALNETGASNSIEGFVKTSSTGIYAWAVTNTDLREVSEPQSIALFSLAIAGLMFSRKKLA